jgi:uncharacterized protein VirK/YbjX
MKNKILRYAQKMSPLCGGQRAVRFFIYAMLHKKEFSEWFKFIETKLPDSFSETIKVKLVLRVARRFIRPWLSLSEKSEILVCHYTTLIKHLSPSGLSVLLGKEAIQLAEFEGRSGRKYIMEMASEVSKEGMLKITLRNLEDYSSLASITGVIGIDDNKQKIFWIGALQGTPPSPNGKKAVIDATKDLNGLRPKQAVLHSICAMSEWLGIKKIIAPSLQNQIAIKNWYRGNDIYAEYALFWEEFTGGTAEVNGDYCLPLPLLRRQLQQVQQKRRKNWLLRYDRVDALALSTVEALKILQQI